LYHSQNRRWNSGPRPIGNFRSLLLHPEFLGELLQLLLDLFLRLHLDLRQLEWGGPAGRDELDVLLRLFRPFRLREELVLELALGDRLPLFSKEPLADHGNGQLGDLPKGLKDADAVDGGRFDEGQPPRVQEVVEGLDGYEVVQVPLVVLEYERDLVEVDVVFQTVAAQAVEVLQVGVEERDLGVADEDDAVGPFQDTLPGGLVESLAGNGHQLEVDPEFADDAGLDGEEVEEEGPFGLGLQADEVAPEGGIQLKVYITEVGRLAAQAGAVVDDLNGQVLRRVIDKSH